MIIKTMVSNCGLRYTIRDEFIEVSYDVNPGLTLDTKKLPNKEITIENLIDFIVNYETALKNRKDKRIGKIKKR